MSGVSSLSFSSCSHAGPARPALLLLAPGRGPPRRATPRPGEGRPPARPCRRPRQRGLWPRDGARHLPHRGWHPALPGPHRPPGDLPRLRRLLLLRRPPLRRHPRLPGKRDTSLPFRRVDTGAAAARRAHALNPTPLAAGLAPRPAALLRAAPHGHLRPRLRGARLPLRPLAAACRPLLLLLLVLLSRRCAPRCMRTSPTHLAPVAAARRHRRSRLSS